MAAARPELVLLPGLDGTGDLFDRLQRRLSKDIDVTVVRYPADPALGYDDYVAFARDAIGARRVVVLGESFSGPVAVKLAVAMPDQTAGLILAGTFLKSPWPAFLIRRTAGVNPHRAPKFARDAFLMGRLCDKDISATVDGIIARLTPGLRESRLRAVAGIDVRPEFSSLTCPILALHGTADWLVPPRAMTAAITSKPGAEIALFPAAHMLLQTRPGDAAEAILKFIGQLESSA